MGSRIPDFFIVGAPKCGTTALYTYLRQHPEIFMPDVKELNFFCSDLGIPSLAADEHAYLSLFTGASGKKRAGEASVWYLYSPRAASAIRDFNVDSLIIIMLRDPVDMLYSLHSQRVYNGVESIKNFEKAINNRRPDNEGYRLLIDNGLPAGPFNLSVGKYSSHVRRYISTFGHERVKIILYDDFKNDTTSVYRSVLDYLGVAPDFTPSFEIVNPNKQVRNVLLHRMVRTPSTPVRALVRALVPRPVRQRAAERIARANSKRTPRAPMPADLRRRLTGELASDIEDLGRLLRRDLTHWLSV